MGTKVKSLCKWKSSAFEKDLAKLKEIVRVPVVVCRDCGRAANDKKHLCKPVKL